VCPVYSGLRRRLGPDEAQSGGVLHRRQRPQAFQQLQISVQVEGPGTMCIQMLLLAYILANMVLHTLFRGLPTIEILVLEDAC
jgi:hypothetical protein